MQCTSYIPLYYCGSNHNTGANNFSWPIYNGNVSYKSRKSHNISSAPCSVDQYFGYDKEVMRRIILEHEATFRLQVQELHRLYKRQKELMGEMREREIPMQHLQQQTSESYAHSCCQVSHVPSWLFGNSSASKLYAVTADSFQEPPPLVIEKSVKGVDTSLTKNFPTEVETLSSQSKRYGKRILDLELPADAYNDNEEGEQLEEGNIGEAPDIQHRTLKKLSDIQPESGSRLDSDNLTYSCRSNLICTNNNCLIDLNEPLQLESLSSNSTGPFETDTSHMEIVHSDQDVTCDKGTGGISYSGLIDLNSTPLTLSEATIAPEKTRNIEDETILEDSEGRAKSDAEVDDKFSSYNNGIDLNSGVTEDEPSPSVQDRDDGNDMEIDLESSPHTEKSDSSLLETPHFLLVQDEEPMTELDRIAAENLVLVSSSRNKQQMNSGNDQPLENSCNSLYWFAGIVSSVGGEVLNDFEAMTLKLLDEHIDYIYQDIQKGKETVDATCCGQSSSGRTRGTWQLKDFKLEDGVQMNEGILKTGSRRRNAVSNTSAKQQKTSSSRPSNRAKKSVSSILKQPFKYGKQGFLDGFAKWGNIKRRQVRRPRKIYH